MIGVVGLDSVIGVVSIGSEIGVVGLGVVGLLDRVGDDVGTIPDKLW
jgi:hypothetical protein